jgi:hypothetical protein
MCSELLLDAAGRRRSPAAMPGHNAGQAPRNKSRVYPADPVRHEILPVDGHRNSPQAAVNSPRGRPRISPPVLSPVLSARYSRASCPSRRDREAGT